MHYSEVGGLPVYSFRPCFYMKKILIPIDFSENTEKVISAAKRIASRTGAELAILHEYQPYVEDISILVPINKPAYQELENSHRQKLEQYVSQARKEGFQTEGIWESKSIHSGILKYAREFNADLIVVGRSGDGGFLNRLLGNYTTGIALDAPCPVLVIPSEVIASEFKQVVYATQLEYEEIDILHEVKRLTDQLGARLTLVKISSFEQPDIQSDNQYIEQIKAALDLPFSDIIVHKGSSVLGGIEAYCDQVKADLLIVSTRERGFLEQFIINPSVTGKLVVETHLPLLHIKEE